MLSSPHFRNRIDDCFEVLLLESIIILLILALFSSPGEPAHTDGSIGDRRFVASQETEGNHDAAQIFKEGASPVAPEVGLTHTILGNVDPH